MTHTILLVEDEDELREMMAEALELSGYSVISARDGQEALDGLDANGPLCLIVLDLVMPRMNGWEFYERMRTRPDLAALPVVVHSSAASRVPRGVAQVLQKPIELDRLLSVVRTYCAA